MPVRYLLTLPLAKRRKTNHKSSYIFILLRLLHQSFRHQKLSVHETRGSTYNIHDLSCDVCSGACFVKPFSHTKLDCSGITASVSAIHNIQNGGPLVLSRDKSQGYGHSRPESVNPRIILTTRSIAVSVVSENLSAISSDPGKFEY